MSIITRGYCNNSTVENIDQDWQLFRQNIDLFLNNIQKILNVADYFFISPAFSYCSFPYISGDGQLYLGYLLLGFTTGQLIEHCSACKAKVLITSVAGSPLTGRNSWTGICITCHQIINGKQSPSFRHWMDFVLDLRQAFPAAIPEQQEYESFEFNWGEPSLKPVRKTKTIWKPIADEPIILSVLTEELTANNIRKGRPINVSLLKRDLKLKFSSNGMSAIRF